MQWLAIYVIHLTPLGITLDAMVVCAFMGKVEYVDAQIIETILYKQGMVEICTRHKPQMYTQCRLTGANLNIEIGSLTYLPLSKYATKNLHGLKLRNDQHSSRFPLLHLWKIVSEFQGAPSLCPSQHISTMCFSTLRSSFNRTLTGLKLVKYLPVGEPWAPKSHHPPKTCKCWIGFWVSCAKWHTLVTWIPFMLSWAQPSEQGGPPHSCWSFGWAGNCERRERPRFISQVTLISLRIPWARSHLYLFFLFVFLKFF
jgi:hypothetical protein